MRLFSYFKLIRPYQWYKNLIIFLPLFFVGGFFGPDLLPVITGFVALCLVSSANYVLNDLIDIKRDRSHPEKKSRPLAAKKVTIAEAILLSLILLVVSLFLSFPLGFLFFLSVVFLFLFTLLYSFFLKHEPIADVVSIAINFVVRAISGALIIQVVVSPWLVLCPFFLALVLVVGKREAEVRFMKKKATQYKEVLKYYTAELIHSMMMVSITALVMSYALYSFSRTPLMLVTVPFAVYGIFRYYYLVQIGSPIARHPERIIKDWRSVITFIILAALVYVIFYVVLGRIDLWNLV